MTIHPTAIVSSGATIGAGVQIGPYCSIGDEVTIGDNCQFDSHVVVEGPTVIGSSNRFFPFCVIGAQPQEEIADRRSRHKRGEAKPRANLGARQGGWQVPIG